MIKHILETDFLKYGSATNASLLITIAFGASRSRHLRSKMLGLLKLSELFPAPFFLYQLTVENDSHISHKSRSEGVGGGGGKIGSKTSHWNQQPP